MHPIAMRASYLNTIHRSLDFILKTLCRRSLHSVFRMVNWSYTTFFKSRQIFCQDIPMIDAMKMNRSPFRIQSFLFHCSCIRFRWIRSWYLKLFVTVCTAKSLRLFIARVQCAFTIVWLSMIIINKYRKSIYKCMTLQWTLSMILTQ